MNQNHSDLRYASRTCPSCHSGQVFVFYEMQGVPLNSVLLLNSREEALSFPKGDLSLGFCRSCGFIYNLAFDPGLLEYSDRYEATQSFSPSFNAFHRNLAERLVDRYELRHKTILEIGCGQGEFLSLLCDVGGNRGVGFDPVYDGKRPNRVLNESITFIKDYYSEKYAHVEADFVCCKMTLEHIQDVAKFVGMVGHILKDKPNTTAFFQVPDVVRILRETAFWDIYYEHCSYFSLGSLARLFRRSGFDIVDLEKDFGDQYLMITAKTDTDGGTLHENENDLSSLKQDVANFVKGYQLGLETWRKRLDVYFQTGKKIVVWGASSKTVAFLTGLRIINEIEYAVDINPHKAGTYIAGTGQKIQSPEFLRTYKPDIVIIMNPIYNKEIESMLNDLGVGAKLLIV